MYNKFSDLYDDLVFDIDYKKYANNIFNILEKCNLKNANLLEIGAGTGNLTLELAKDKSLRILAFDNSIEMLNHAYKKVKNFNNVNIIEYDMYKFPFSKFKFDAIISLLDVMNYIIDRTDLEGIFKDIYSSLNKGGVFIFDLNSRYKLKEVLGNNVYIYEKDNIFYTWENEIDEDDEDLIYFDLNFFIKEKDKYTRIKEEQIERYYSIEFIINLLKRIGFSSIEYLDEDGGEFIENKTQRILFSAKK